jgi:hypothetical protein
MRRISSVTILTGVVCASQLLGAARVDAAPTPLFERDWVEVTKTTRPPANGALVYDSARNENVLFVPAVEGGRASQTWTFNGATRNWTKESPANSPDIYDAVAAYDIGNERVVVLGRDPDEGSCGENDTWTWDGSNWTEQAPATAPTGCVLGASYRQIDGEVVAITGDGSISETWIWSGVDWEMSNSSTTPPHLGMATAADPRTGGVLAFGGDFFFHGNHFSADTRAWTGSAWTRINAGGGAADPQPRSDSSMTWDSKLGSMILFGGIGGSSATKTFNDTFRWDTTQWTRMGTAHTPPAMEGASLANNPTSGSVLFNGARTWVFTAKASAGRGYAATNRAGVVAVAGDAAHRGDLAGKRLTQPVVGIARTPTRNGYWLVAGDGGIFSFGDARFYGSTGAQRLNKPIVGMAATPSGQGYWLVATDGGVFTFGDARFYGSTGGQRLNKPIVAMAAKPTGNGYWLTASDGGIFTFGDARFYGSTGAKRLNKPIVAMASTPNGKGYWLAAADGGVFTFGEAQFEGAGPGAATIVAMASSPTGNGYRLFGNFGVVQAFGDATRLGNMRITGAVAAFST